MSEEGTRDADVAVIGSGFGGSLLALVARRARRSVVLLEKGTHPRFVIGESSTPLSNLLLEEVARRWDLPRLLPFCKFGPWRRERPDVSCGLKRGFTFYRHERDAPFAGRPDRADQLLVAASPRNEVADTHWYRPEFDHALVREAIAAGADYRDRVELDGATETDDGMLLTGSREGRRFAVKARLVVDATGPRGFLHRTLGLPSGPCPHLPPTQGLYSHFTGVARLDGMEPFTRFPGAPYPIDDAAVHHVFPGGWIWVLRFGNGITSAGVTARDAVADELGFAEGEAAWHRLLDRLPTVKAQFREARATLPFVHAPRLSFASHVAAGRRWALLPYAAGFVDPLLSAGFPLTLLGVVRLGELLERARGDDALADALHHYEEATLRERDTAELLIAALWSAFDDFPLFRQLTLLYFAAATWTEACRRLGVPERAPGFLLAGEPRFSAALASCCADALALPAAGRPERTELRAALIAKVRAAIEPFDVAGLGRADRDAWYPFDADDLRAARGKLGVGAAAVEGMLARYG